MAPAGPPYAELHVRSCYTFLRGASHPEELVARAAHLGYSALALTDDGSLGGVVRAHLAGRTHAVRPLVGAAVTLEEGPELLLYPQDRAGYGRLSTLLTVGRRRAPKGSYLLGLPDVLDHATGLLAICLGEDPRHLKRVGEAFGDRAYLALTLLRGPDDPAALARRRALSEACALPLVVTGDVHCHVRARKRLQDVMTCVREGLTLDEACRRGVLFPNGERVLRARPELARVYAEAQDALARTLEVADRITFSLDELRYEYPNEFVPAGQSASEYLAELTQRGADARYPAGVPAKVRRILEHELSLIAELAYEPFFLTVYEIVAFARSQKILVQGRGSAANSAVCFCLGITSVDPDTFDVLFERFVSRARDEPPDIDVDIEHERREEVIQHIYERYGRDRAALASEVICYRSRSALREVAKAFGHGDQPLQPDDDSGRHALALEVAREIQGMPRHRSQHVGGFVITRGPLAEFVPIENAAMPGRTVVEWDKNDIDALGVMKVDCLGLGILTCIRKSFDLIRGAGGESLELASVPKEDPQVYAMLCRADAIGVFQVESRAQLNMLPRLQPRCFYDLVIEVSLVRPGPIQGGMVHPYLRRRAGLEVAEPIHPAVERVLEKTLGVPIFQEQAMRLAIELVGFSPDEAEALRKAMGAWRRPGTIEAFEERFVQGAIAKGVKPELAERLFDQIKGFGEYGFPEGHAASFARLAYISAWLKRYYPAAFTAALLNSQPMGFYAPAQLVRDAREHGVEVLPVDVEASGWDARLELVTPEGAIDRVTRARSEARAPDGDGFARWGEAGPALRLGLRLVHGLGEAAGRAVEAARRVGPLRTVPELSRRTRLRKDELERLADADAFRSLAQTGFAQHADGRPRREALFDALAEGQREFPLFAGHDVQETQPTLPALGECGEVVTDYAATGLSLRRHPMSFAREALSELRAKPIASLTVARDRTRVIVAGLVICRQRPSTAGGIVFVTIEDETGTANLIVRPKVLERYARLVVSGPALLVRGTVEREGPVIHVLVRSLRDVASLLPSLRIASHDFH